MIRIIPAGRYEITDKEPVERGVMGVLYRGIDTLTRRQIAIKRIRDLSDRRSVEMFEKEWRVLASLDYPTIVKVLDVAQIEENGKRNSCFIMPWLTGVTLARLIDKRSDRLSSERVVGIISQVCKGLQFAHDASLVHRDIKPSNIFILPDDMPVLIDFGVVHFHGSQSIGFKGTWRYAAPEQVGGKEPTKLSDIFSLGVVYYEALTGLNPFLRVDSEGRLDQNGAGEAIKSFMPPGIYEINSRASLMLSQAVQAALAKQPIYRYASARQFGESLQKAYQNQPLNRFNAETFSSGSGVLAVLSPGIARWLPTSRMTSKLEATYTLRSLGCGPRSRRQPGKSEFGGYSKKLRNVLRSTRSHLRSTSSGNTRARAR
ncbi:MAG: serine/threonine protein kinase [Bryobacteraceae bacterium]